MRIAQNAVKLGQLIDDILAYTRAGSLALERHEVDLERLVRGLANELQQSYPATAIAVGALPRVMGDPTMLHQVLQNLLANACKFSAQREQPAVEVGVREARGAAVFFVKDNGAGFDMRYAGKLFGMFQRMHTESEFAGTGVGLSIVKRLIDRHGGGIWAESEPDCGATFFFTLGAGDAPVAASPP